MYTLIKTQKRLSEDTPFFFECYKYPVEYLKYVNKNYIETGKLINYQKIVSSDNMTVEYTSTWLSRDVFLSYVTDEIVYDFISKANDHDINNDIESSLIIKKE
jgi:hypothetical protein